MCGTMESMNLFGMRIDVVQIHLHSPMKFELATEMRTYWMDASTKEKEDESVEKPSQNVKRRCGAERYVDG